MEPTVAYFSMEIAIDPAIPSYSGGLGVLAGDHLKSASDLGIPLVGIGLFYRQGYFRQRVDADGNQHEEYITNDPTRLPLELATDLGIRNIQLAGYDVYYEPADRHSRERFIEGMQWAAAQAPIAELSKPLRIAGLGRLFIGRLRRGFGFDGDRLWITVHESDDEAEAMWHEQVGVPMDRIQRLGDKDNFWQMGDTGPCGPCSEIFFDHGDHIPGGPPGSSDQDGDRFIEIWNLVFMQFEQVTREERVSLPKPSIDTGMGLERIAAVLQGKHNNYDIDLFRSIIEAVAHETGVSPDGPQGASHKVIADHLRATSFLIADGVLPSNEGRGYVLRRIMRRAMRHAHILGAQDPMVAASAALKGLAVSLMKIAHDLRLLASGPRCGRLSATAQHLS